MKAKDVGMDIMNDPEWYMGVPIHKMARAYHLHVKMRMNAMRGCSTLDGVVDEDGRMDCFNIFYIKNRDDYVRVIDGVCDPVVSVRFVWSGYERLYEVAPITAMVGDIAVVNGERFPISAVSDIGVDGHPVSFTVKCSDDALESATIPFSMVSDVLRLNDSFQENCVNGLYEDSNHNLLLNLRGRWFRFDKYWNPIVPNGKWVNPLEHGPLSRIHAL